MGTRSIDDLLSRVQRVDPPPFLLTRIEARLADGGSMTVPRFRVIAVVCGLALLLCANVAVLMQSNSGTSSSNEGQVVEVMGMNASNQLYHD